VNGWHGSSASFKKSNVTIAVMFDSAFGRMFCLINDEAKANMNDIMHSGLNVNSLLSIRLSFPYSMSLGQQIECPPLSVWLPRASSPTSASEKSLVR
jgi:hypothetical protein